MPATLATRHGLIRAYFERRILPGASARAGPRRFALDLGASAITNNSSRWSDLSTAAQELLSEGVLTQKLGRLTFRHALLRDFAVALTLSEQKPHRIAECLASIQNPIIRADLLRAVIEACVDPLSIGSVPAFDDVVRACTTRGITAGVALAATDAPTASMVVAIAEIGAGGVLAQAVDRAKLVGNRAWIRAVASVGGARPKWLSGRALEGLATLADFARQALGPAEVALAKVLRIWTWGYDVCHENAWTLVRISKLLAHALPDDETLAWLSSMELGRYSLAGEPLDHICQMARSNPGLTGSRLYHALERTAFEFWRRGALPRHMLRRLDSRFLGDRDGRAGLLKMRPDVASAFVFELSAADKEAQSREDDERWESKAEVLQDLAAMSPAPDPEVERAERTLRRHPTLKEPEAFGGLVDDVPHSDTRLLHEIDSLFTNIEKAALDENVAIAVGRSAVGSRSIRARLMVLGLMHQSAELDRLRYQILEDPRIYHSRNVLPRLRDAISGSWPNLAEASRQCVQRNILERARSSWAEVGCLATAIPGGDLDPELLPHLEFLEARRRSRKSAPESPSSEEPGYLNREDENDPRFPIPRGTSRQTVEVWHSLDRVSDGPSEHDALIIALHKAITGDHLVGEVPEWVWATLAFRLRRDLQRQEQPAMSAADAAALFRLAMDRARDPTRRGDPAHWGSLIDILDKCAGHPELAHDDGLRAELMEEVIAAAGECAERQELADQAICKVSGPHWFGPESPGRPVIENWFKRYLNGEGLDHALRFLPCLAINERIEWIKAVLEARDRLDIHSGRDVCFVDEAGRHLAGPALSDHGSGARDLLKQWCEQDARPGVLGQPSGWRHFLHGFAWALQGALGGVRANKGRPPTEYIARFTQLAETVWSAWTPPTGRHDQEAIGGDLVAPLQRDFAGPEHDWGAELGQLLVRVMAGGGRRDISYALHDLDWTLLPVRLLPDVVGAIVSRLHGPNAYTVDSWPRDQLIDALVEIVELPAAPSAVAHRILDCLHKLGQTVSKANQVALVVERIIGNRFPS